MKIKKERMPFFSYEKKKKYNIQAKEDVVVVEKDNTIFNIVVVIIKIVLYTILLSLAFIGFVSLLVPETREILSFQAVNVFDEFTHLLGGG